MSWIDIVLSMAVLYCVYTDIKARKIRNYITFPLMGVGLIYNIFVAGLDELYSPKGMLLVEA